MSVHYIYKGAGGAKMMRPVPNREEYLKLRNGGFQVSNVARIRQGDEALKSSLVQMNYSCLPNEDGTLKGSKRMSTTVGMDIDHLTAEEMPAVRQRILSKKGELGLLMLEESARGGEGCQSEPQHRPPDAEKLAQAEARGARRGRELQEAVTPSAIAALADVEQLVESC